MSTVTPGTRSSFWTGRKTSRGSPPYGDCRSTVSSVAAPLTLIHTGGTGYLMPLASDMKPIREPYLPREFGARETNAAWYRQTGGLRRRLAIAANMARSVAALHERGLAYVDLNPGNVMVSDDLNRTETWLIDTDNLTSRSAPKWDILGFPGYVAPERKLRKAPPSTLADTYILAIHVFRLLVLRLSPRGGRGGQHGRK